MARAVSLSGSEPSAHPRKRNRSLSWISPDNRPRQRTNVRGPPASVARGGDKNSIILEFLPGAAGLLPRGRGLLSGLKKRAVGIPSGTFCSGPGPAASAGGFEEGLDGAKTWRPATWIQRSGPNGPILAGSGVLYGDISGRRPSPGPGAWARMGDPRRLFHVKHWRKKWQGIQPLQSGDRVDQGASGGRGLVRRASADHDHLSLADRPGREAGNDNQGGSDGRRKTIKKTKQFFFDRGPHPGGVECAAPAIPGLDRYHRSPSDDRQPTGDRLLELRRGLYLVA